ncbi:MarR family winged helix-turn-helix transcriptional regulator [Massilia sp. PAMC28688]|uniref:MarR family winged helix-turn-helix transcriptional regulator n=1 Tax=Massilia sp. PAMC28688 TaxID=2861283 RepID=UPI001E37FED9|nr:MarR family winged helix-turn-helix transcriptional regulator [Massilia sp. PAMC28688]
MPRPSPQPLEKPLGCTCFKLRKLTRAMSRLYDQHLAQAGLKTTQYSVLVNAARAALPVADMADLLGLDRTTLTRNLKPLIESGWVVLKSGSDSRQRIVTITAAGRRKVEQAYVAWRAAQTAFEQLMGREAVRSLHRQLDTTMLHLTPLLKEASDA